jgi:hypothetical protein
MPAEFLEKGRLHCAPDVDCRKAAHAAADRTTGHRNR